MDQSLSLLAAQVHFLDTELALIHIPLHLYSFFLQPILQLLLPNRSTPLKTTGDSSLTASDFRSRNPWASEHPFVNVSLTPVECSVACSRTLANKLFAPIRDKLPKELRGENVISQENYVVVQVDGEGLEAGQRVLDLTGPLAMNGISIFFITTYFCDYILVPLRSRSSVITALEEHGFAFHEDSDAFVNVSSPILNSTSTPRSGSGHSNSSGSSFESNNHMFSIDDDKPPRTPPPSSISELETRTFALLARQNVVPTVDPSIRLIQCAGRKDDFLRADVVAASSNGIQKPSSNKSIDRMHLGLMRSLISSPLPRFFSVTLTDEEPASLLLEQKSMIEFEDAGDEILLGSREDVLVPITLDLRGLPMESTGIVCGVAGRLLGATANHTNGNGSHSPSIEALSIENHAPSALPVEMSYLSTAMAGTVMVAETELERAMIALRIKR